MAAKELYRKGIIMNVYYTCSDSVIHVYSCLNSQMIDSYVSDPPKQVAMDKGWSSVAK